jgi:urease accessory protein
MKTIDKYHTLKTKTTWVSALIFSLPAMAMAHPGHYGHGGALPSLSSGFLHPLSGMDHMMLALAMGWLAFSPGTHRTKLPAVSFLAALTVGALCGRWISGGTGLEIAISLTILAAGGVMMRDRLRGLGTLSMVAVAGGLVHGLAHGAEALPSVSFLTYGVGLLISTALLLGAGGLLQHAFSRSGHPLVALRVAGVVMIATGITSLISIL